MTRISKRPLRKSLEDRMLAIFWQCFVDFKTAREVFAFMDELLSPAEKIMLTKRLAIAVLVEKGWNYDDISHAVKVSTTTVNSIRNKIADNKTGGYQKAARKIIANENLTKLLEDMAVGLTTVVSPIGKIGLAAGLKQVARVHRFSQKLKRDIL